MKNDARHLYMHQGKIAKEDRWQLNGHRSALIWLTGLSASGKSTLAYELDACLYRDGVRTYVLDGDNIRHGLNNDLGFSAEDRTENIRRIGEVGKLLTDAGVLTMAAFISPYREDRRRVRELFAEGEFIEIYIKCALEVCAERDPKGHYEKARQGAIKNFTGISDPYEAPEAPEIVIETDRLTVEESTEKILSYLIINGVIHRHEAPAVVGLQ